MNNDKLLNQIGELMDRKLDPIKTDLNGVKTELNGVKIELNGVKTDLNGVKTDLNGVKTELKGVKKQLNMLEVRVGSLEVKFELMDKKIVKAAVQMEQTEERLKKVILASQEDTIEALSELIHSGYNLHEERIKEIEDRLKFSPAQ